MPPGFPGHESLSALSSGSSQGWSRAPQVPAPGFRYMRVPHTAHALALPGAQVLQPTTLQRPAWRGAWGVRRREGGALEQGKVPALARPQQMAIEGGARRSRGRRTPHVPTRAVMGGPRPRDAA